MARQNKLMTNMVGGEVSPKLYGRSDLPIFAKAVAKMENFIAQAQGGASFRTGSKLVKTTRKNRPGVLIPFQFNDQQSYLIEATDRFFRFHKDNSIILETAKVITAITAANPGVITSAAHGFNNGDEVFISSVVGVSGINGRFFYVANKTANTFTLQEIPAYESFNNNIYSAGYGTYTAVGVDTTASGAYVSGGTVARVYEVATLYLTDDLETLQYSQNADTMYISSQNYDPKKVTRSGHANWSVATYVRTTDPFTPVTKAIGGISQANPGVVTSAGHGLAKGQSIYITGVTGMTQANGLFYVVGVVVDANNFKLRDRYDTFDIDTTGWTAYAAAGTIILPGSYPTGVAFIDSGRLLFGGTGSKPETVWGSKAPSTGTPNYDDFTTGVAETDAIIFTLAPINGKVDNIQWISNTNRFTVIGTFGAIRVLYGASQDAPVTATAISAKAVNGFGCLRALPVTNGESLFYIQRSSKILRSMEFDIVTQWYVTSDRNLIAEHLTDPGINLIVGQVGRPDIVWAVRNDGRIIGLTFKQKEDISGWHRHYIAGNYRQANGILVPIAKVLSAGRMPRPADDDQMWFIVERELSVGKTIRTVEYLSDYPVYPVRNAYYSGNETVDDQHYNNYLYEVQKGACHLDMVIAYNGTDDTLASDTNLQFALDPNPPHPTDPDDYADTYHTLANIHFPHALQVSADDGYLYVANYKNDSNASDLAPKLSKIRLSDWSIVAEQDFTGLLTHDPLDFALLAQFQPIRVSNVPGQGEHLFLTVPYKGTAVAWAQKVMYVKVRTSDMTIQGFALLSTIADSNIWLPVNMAQIQEVPLFGIGVRIPAGLGFTSRIYITDSTMDLTHFVDLGTNYFDFTTCGFAFVFDDRGIAAYDHIWMFNGSNLAAYTLDKIDVLTGLAVQSIPITPGQVFAPGFAGCTAMEKAGDNIVFVVGGNGGDTSWMYTVDINAGVQTGKVQLIGTNNGFSSVTASSLLVNPHDQGLDGLLPHPRIYATNSYYPGEGVVYSSNFPPAMGGTAVDVQAVVPNTPEDWTGIAAKHNGKRIYVAYDDSAAFNANAKIADLRGQH